VPRSTPAAAQGQEHWTESGGKPLFLRNKPATGVDFNLIPYGGGNPATMAAIGLETDCCSLPVSLPISLGDQVRILCVFANENPVPEATRNAPTANAAFGLGG